MASVEDNTESSASEDLVTSLSSSLQGLLRAPPAQFWKAVKGNASLTTFIGTYLQFCRRPHDAEAQAGGSAPSPARRELAKFVFIVLSRMVSSESGGISREEQRQWLARGAVVDIPRLFDIAVLYGAANRALVEGFIRQVFSLQPKVQSNLAAAIPVVANNLADVAATCSEAVRGVRGDAAIQTLRQISDGLAFLLDVFATLAAFTEVHPPAALLLLAEGCPVVTTLSSVHCQLLPAVHKCFSVTGNGAGSATAFLQVHAELACRIRKLLHVLLAAAYLQPGTAEAWAAGPSGSRGTVFEARGRGQGLLAALQAAVNGGGGGDTGVGMLKLMDGEHRTSEAVATALQQGHLALDQGQQDRVCALLGLASLPPPAPSTTAGGSHGENGSSWDAERRGLLKQIQEVLPGYGEGFLIACLDAAGQNAERVITQLLEGTLPPELARLDKQMPAAAPQAGGASSSGRPSGLAWAELESQQLEVAKARAPRVPTPSGKALPSAHRGTAFAMQATQQERAVAKLHAQAAQWEEYDDEYDDSFDDLTDFGADAGAETQGDRLEAQPGGFPTSSNDSFPPLPGGFPSQTGRGPGRQPAGRGGKPLWVLEGRIYNYAKEGAAQVANQQAAEAAVREFQAQGEMVDGLGAGGNKAQSAAAGDEGRESTQSRGTPGGGGRGRGRGQGGRGQGRNSHAFKDAHKAAIANHHRKDRALRKAGGPPG